MAAQASANNTNATTSASSSSTLSSSSSSSSSVAPKILLAKPISSSVDSTSQLRSRVPSVGSLNLLSDSWDFHTERILPFLTENTDFTVIGVIGPPGAGKSTILNEVYGFDGSSPGMLPPFATHSEETRATARHCTTGIELRVSTERLILLDTQPIFSPSILAEMMRPDGSSAIPSSNDPSSTSSYSQASNLVSEKENNDDLEAVEEYLACPVFVHTKLRDEDMSPLRITQLKKAVSQYFSSSSFARMLHGGMPKDHSDEHPHTDVKESYPTGPDLFVLPRRCEDDLPGALYESFATSLGKLRDQVLAMKCLPFAKIISEREWLRNSARIWEIVKNSPVIAEYSKTLQDSGMFRR